MARFLLDEMYLPTAAQLRDVHHHDAVHVNEIGLDATDDADFADVARAESRALVAENVADFADQRDLTLVFVLKILPASGGQAGALAVA